MPIFTYQAKDADGHIKQGMIDAGNEQLAVSLLVDHNLKVVTIKRKRGLNFNLNFLNRIKAKEVVIFSRQFSVMISASIPVVQALKVLIDQTVSPALKAVVSEIADEVNGGSKLSDALAARPKIFSGFYVSVVRAGETSGKLDEVLNYLADEMEKDYDMMHKIRGAMIYPVFVLVGLTGVGGVMVVWVVPKLTAVIAESGGQLPLATRILMAVSDAAASYWWLVILIAAGLAAAVKYYGKTAVGRWQIDYLKLKMPIFGQLFQKIAIVRFTRSMNTLIAGGVAIASSLKIAADVVGNSVYHDLIMRTKQEVEGGSSISSVFSASKEIPSMVAQMLAVGEKTGKLDIILERITDFYAREVNNLVANLVTLMEPLIMVLMGIGVGIMVAAIIMPMYNLANQF